MKESSVQWPEVSAHLASKMLLEIGIEKLRRDYVTLFVGKEVLFSTFIKVFKYSFLI